MARLDWIKHIFKFYMLRLLSRDWLYVTPWTAARQPPLSMGFSRQEDWSGLPFPPPRDLPDPGIKPWSPALQADSLLPSHWGSPKLCIPEENLPWCTRLPWWGFTFSTGVWKNIRVILLLYLEWPRNGDFSHKGPSILLTWHPRKNSGFSSIQWIFIDHWPVCWALCGA